MVDLAKEFKVQCYQYLTWNVNKHWRSHNPCCIIKKKNSHPAASVETKVFFTLAWLVSVCCWSCCSISWRHKITTLKDMTLGKYFASYFDATVLYDLQFGSQSLKEGLTIVKRQCISRSKYIPLQGFTVPVKLL